MCSYSKSYTHGARKDQVESVHVVDEYRTLPLFESTTETLISTPLLDDLEKTVLIQRGTFRGAGDRYSALGRPFWCERPEDGTAHVGHQALFLAWVRWSICGWHVYRAKIEGSKLHAYDLGEAMTTLARLKRHLVANAGDEVNGLYHKLLRKQGFLHICAHRPHCKAFINTDGNTDLHWFICIFEKCFVRPEQSRLLCNGHFVKPLERQSCDLNRCVRTSTGRTGLISNFETDAEKPKTWTVEWDDDHNSEVFKFFDVMQLLVYAHLHESSQPILCPPCRQDAGSDDDGDIGSGEKNPRGSQVWAKFRKPVLRESVHEKMLQDIRDDMELSGGVSVSGMSLCRRRQARALRV